MDEYMLPHYTPKFLWLLRDFSENIKDSHGMIISASQYLENCLFEDIGNPAIRSIKKSIIAFFKDR